MNATALLMAAISALPNDSSMSQNPDSTSIDPRNLDELVIEVKKKIIKAEGDKITYDLQQDKSSKGATLLDALRNVPLVAVSGDDKITINGNSNFQIYLNGKPNPMLTANYAQVFKAMPADAVSKIEVITEPGAKYDAEGTGGILNIITQQQQSQEGYSGNLTAGSSNKNHVANGFASAKRGKLSFDANITLAKSSFEPSDNIASQETSDSKTGISSLLKVNQSFNFKLINSAANLSWEPNSQNLFTLGANISNLKAASDNLSASQQIFAPGNSKPISSTAQQTDFNLQRLSASTNASFQHNFGAEQHHLILLYLFNFGKDPQHAYTQNTNLINPEIILPMSASLQNDFTREHTGQIDYSLPLLSNKHTFEAGAKMILRRNSTYSYSLSGPDKANLHSIADKEVTMDQIQDVFALYSTYSANFLEKWKANAGIRYEHTNMGTKSLSSPNLHYNSQLNDLVPNAAITYIFSPLTNIRLAYQMRISRPSLSQISPFQQNIIENVVETGNPNLTSERNNNLSLTYSAFLGIIGGRISLEYANTNNAVEKYIYYNGNTEITTFLNIGHREIFSLNPLLMLNLSNKLTAQISGGISYNSLSSPSISNKGWTGNYSTNISYTAPLDIRLVGYAGQQIHGIQLQGSNSGYNYYGLAINRDFLKNKSLNISIRSTNFLNKYITYTQTQTVGTRTIKTEGKSANRDLGITISWRFGNLKERRKTASTTITNDDNISTKSTGTDNLGL